MTQFSASATLQQAEKEYGLGKGEYLKIQEGDNKIRLLSETLPHQSIYKGQKTFKFVCWVIDRKDQKIKPYFMPISILRAIESLQLDEEWAFESVPMPYDINIKAKNAGQKEVVYTVMGSKNNIPLTDQEKADFEAKTPIKDFQEKLKQQEPNEPTEEVNTGITQEEYDKIPF